MPDREPTDFERAGMDWWNSLPEHDRRSWLVATGPNGSAAKAYQKHLSGTCDCDQPPHPGDVKITIEPAPDCETVRDAARLAMFRDLIEAGERVVYDLPNNHAASVFAALLAEARKLQ